LRRLSRPSVNPWLGLFVDGRTKEEAMMNREQNRPNDALQSGKGQPAGGQDEREFGAGGQPNDNLKRNPGIGQSKGSFATGVRPTEIEGENTVDGDIDNDSTPTDGVPERERARTNA
jgi:hypothetical protein